MKHVAQQTEGDCGFNIHSHLPDFGFERDGRILIVQGVSFFSEGSGNEMMMPPMTSPNLKSRLELNK